MFSFLSAPILLSCLVRRICIHLIPATHYIDVSRIWHFLNMWRIALNRTAIEIFHRRRAFTTKFSQSFGMQSFERHATCNVSLALTSAVGRVYPLPGGIPRIYILSSAAYFCLFNSRPQYFQNFPYTTHVFHARERCCCTEDSPCTWWPQNRAQKEQGPSTNRPSTHVGMKRQQPHCNSGLLM